MKKYILNSTFNWADEHDITVRSIMTEDMRTSWLENKDEMIEIIGNDEERYYFGTNQSVTFTMTDIFSMIESSVELSPDEDKVLKKYNSATFDILNSVRDRMMDAAYDVFDGVDDDKVKHFEELYEKLDNWLV